MLMQILGNKQRIVWYFSKWPTNALKIGQNATLGFMGGDVAISMAHLNGSENYRHK